MKFKLLFCAGLLFGIFSSNAATLASFQAGDGGWHMGTLAVGNLDNDSQLEIVVPYRNLQGQWFLDAFKWNGAHIAGFPYASGSEEMNVSPTLYDLDRDDRQEIIFTRGTSLIALRGNGTLVWSNSVNAANYFPQAGFQAFTNGFYWTADNAFRSRLPSTAVFSSQFSSPIVADIDGNGTKEVATAWKIDPDSTSGNQDYNPPINDIFGFGEWGTVGESWSGAAIFFNALTGQRNLTYQIHQLVEAGLGVGQADSDKALEVYVLNDSDSIVCFDKTQPHGFHGNGMLHKMFGKNLRMTTGFYKQAIDIYPSDIDGDGLDELLSVTTQFNCLWQPHDSLLDDDGALMWRKWKQPVTITNNNGWFNNACMFPVNPDHDNHIDVFGFTHSHEITFRYWDGINFVDRAGWPKNFAPFIPTPPVVGDVDGDGQEEILIGTYDPVATPSSGNLFIYALNGTLKQTISVPGGLKHIPFLADVNDDGSLDVIYRSLAGQIYVQNFGATSATNVSWATHRGNAQRDGIRGKSLFPPNTPLITKRDGGFRKASFQWSTVAITNANAFRIYRADQAQGPFTLIATLPANATNYADFGLRLGWQYFYEVAAVVGVNEIRSAPFPILSMLNSNLVANGGFEENDNSHWDKWDTGNIPWTNMIGSASQVYQGKQSMEVTLQNQTTTDTINQYAQYGTPRAYIPVVAGTMYSFGGFFKSAGLNQATKHWFEWTSSLTGENTNARPAVPYPNYFTPQFSIGTGATPWTYLNRVFTLPPGFPNVELRHRFSSAQPANGSIYLDNLFFRTLPQPSDLRWTNLLSLGASWRYLTATPSANWFATNFNDSAWPTASAKFGRGSGPTNVVTQLPANQPAYYFRKTFSVTQTNLEEFLLAATCTDDYGGVIYPLKIFLNGTELITSGIEAVSSTGNEIKYFDLAPFINLLKPGTNTLAVILNNNWQSTWDNIAFDLSLKAIPVAEARISALRYTAGNVELQISASLGTSWRVESSVSPSGPWQLVQTLPALSTSPLWITDLGQNLLGPISSTPVRFYRLVAN
ncbi:MAG: hypothetical protein ABIR24_12415 [Verrucomicrobiota bacterium]